MKQCTRMKKIKYFLGIWYLKSKWPSRIKFKRYCGFTILLIIMDYYWFYLLQMILFRLRKSNKKPPNKHKPKHKQLNKSKMTFLILARKSDQSTILYFQCDSLNTTCMPRFCKHFCALNLTHILLTL